MKRPGPVSGGQAGSNTGMKLVYKIVLVSEIKMK